MKPQKVVSGQQVFYWDVLEDLGINQETKRRQYRCRCQCGTEKVLDAANLTGKKGSKSCGCYRKERLVTHGHSKKGEVSKTYWAWQHMISRCFRPKDKEYENYGGRGITVCETWVDSFQTFLNDMGEKPEGLSLERLEVNGNYCKSNCKWATASEQARNRRNSKWYTHNGETKHVNDWAKEYGLSPVTLQTRVNRGWSLTAALTTPVKPKSQGSNPT